MKDPTSLISRELYSYINYLSGYDKLINYSWKKKGLSKIERQEIKNIFEELDEVTGITFKKTHKSKDDIRFLSVDEINDNVHGQAQLTKKRIKISFRDNDKKVSLLEKYVLRHEVGHALGLSHPGGNGSNPNWDVSDSIMSYNVWDNNGNFAYHGYTDLDHHVLSFMWNSPL